MTGLPMVEDRLPRAAAEGQNQYVATKGERPGLDPQRLARFDRRDLIPGKVQDRKSTRLTPVTNAQLVCRLLLEKKKKQRLQIHLNLANTQRKKNSNKNNKITTPP